MPELPEGYSLVFNAEDEEIQRCMIYLQMKDQRKSDTEIGEHFGYKSRQGMANLRNRWIENGIMEKARQRYFIPKGEEIAAATSRIMANVPIYFERLEKIIRTGKEHNAIEAFRTLYDVVIKPTIEKQPETGKAESDYAKRSDKGISSPLEIPEFHPTPHGVLPAPSLPDIDQEESDSDQNSDTEVSAHSENPQDFSELGIELPL